MPDSPLADPVLSDQALQLDFAKHLRDPEAYPCRLGFPEERVQVYRRLFFNNVRALLSGNFPVATAILGDDFERLLRRFYAAGAAHTPRFTELGRSLIDYLESMPELWQSQWPYLLELMDYEWLELELMLAPDQPLTLIIAESEPLWAVAAELRLRGYQYPVHQLRPQFQPSEPTGPYFLLLYREPAGAVRFMALNPLSACLLDALQGQPASRESALIEALLQLFPHLERALLEAGVKAQLSQWQERGIVRLIHG